jgi:hypothetical protein
MTMWDNKQRAIHKAAAAKRRIADERRRYDTHAYTTSDNTYNCFVATVVTHIDVCNLCVYVYTMHGLYIQQQMDSISLYCYWQT